jgi:hypothetical protein
MLDQESFCQLDPYRNHNQIAATKILKAKVLRLLSGFSVLNQATVQRSTSPCFLATLAFPRQNGAA